MNVPNSLTIARIFFVPLLVAVLVQEKIILHWNGTVITNDYIALIIFLVAGATDLLDGYLARRWGQVTTIGTLLDPIADKLLISAALVSLGVSLLQTLTSVQEQTLTAVPRLVAVFVVTMVTMPWMLHRLTGYTLRLFSDFQRFLG